MNKNVKKIIACILSLAIVACTVLIADIILKDLSSDGVRQSAGIYDQPDNTIDLLMLGSSHVYDGINTAKLWEDYGIAGYDFASAEQSLWVSYHYLIEACKKQKPKVVVLDFFSPAAFLDDYKFKYKYLDDSLYGLKFSFNKLMLMNACFDGNLELWNKYFPSFSGYHDTYNDVKTADMEKLFADHSAFKGYTPEFGREPTRMFELDTESSLPPSNKSVLYMNKIAEYTRRHGIELYITVVPYRVNDERVTGVEQEEDKRYNWLRSYVRQLNESGYSNVYFDAMSLNIESYGLEMGSGDDMDNATHLNYYGSCKFTDYLANELRRLYGEDLLPDHRGEEGYESWDENVKIIREDVLSHGFEWR